jgi:hypothetical protein
MINSTTEEDPMTTPPAPEGDRDGLDPADDLVLELWLRLAALRPDQRRRFAAWVKAGREYRAAMN